MDEKLYLDPFNGADEAEASHAHVPRGGRDLSKWVAARLNEARDAKFTPACVVGREGSGLEHFMRHEVFPAVKADPRTIPLWVPASDYMRGTPIQSVLEEALRTGGGLERIMKAAQHAGSGVEMPYAKAAYALDPKNCVPGFSGIAPSLKRDAAWKAYRAGCGVELMRPETALPDMEARKPDNPRFPDRTDPDEDDVDEEDYEDPFLGEPVAMDYLYRLSVLAERLRLVVALCHEPAPWYDSEASIGNHLDGMLRYSSGLGNTIVFTGFRGRCPPAGTGGMRERWVWRLKRPTKDCILSVLSKRNALPGGPFYTDEALPALIAVSGRRIGDALSLARSVLVCAQENGERLPITLERFESLTGDAA